MWALDEECKKIVAEAWHVGETNMLEDVVMGLQCCASSLESREFKTFRHENSRKRLEWLKKDINFDSNLAKINELEEKLEKLLDHDEIYWKQHSRME